MTNTEYYRQPLKNSFKKLTKWRCVPRSFAPAVRTCLREHFDNAVAAEKIELRTKWVL